MYQNFIIPYLYEAQHVSGDTLPIIRSLKLHWQPLVFHTWKVVGRVVGGLCQAHCAWQRPATTRPTTFHVWKTWDCQRSFSLLMMGGVSPDTCWALYKYGIIKFWYIVASCWIFLYELNLSFLSVHSFRSAHQNSVRVSLPPHTCHKPRLFWSVNFWWDLPVINFFFMQISPICCVWLPLRPKYLQQRSNLKHRQPLS